jgi:ISXO2 transposase-like protein
MKKERVPLAKACQYPLHLLPQLFLLFRGECNVGLDLRVVGGVVAYLWPLEDFWSGQFKNASEARQSHSHEESVNGDIHTNTVESVWSLQKRSMIGPYHKLSMKHLDAHLDELDHRFNNRDNEFLFRDALSKLVKAEKFPYEKLTKAA